MTIRVIPIPRDLLYPVCRYPQEGQPPSDDDLHRDWLRSDQAADVTECRWIVSHRAKRGTAAKALAEEPR